MKVEQTACSETSAYTIQTPRNYPEESMLNEADHSPTLLSRLRMSGCIPLLSVKSYNGVMKISRFTVESVKKTFKIRRCLEL